MALTHVCRIQTTAAHRQQTRRQSEVHEQIPTRQKPLGLNCMLTCLHTARSCCSLSPTADAAHAHALPQGRCSLECAHYTCTIQTLVYTSAPCCSSNTNTKSNSRSHFLQAHVAHHQDLSPGTLCVHTVSSNQTMPHSNQHQLTTTKYNASTSTCSKLQHTAVLPRTSAAAPHKQGGIQTRLLAGAGSAETCLGLLSPATYM
jgi:hypothetical protein